MTFRDLAADSRQHQLPPGVRWAKRYRCLHKDEQGRVGANGNPQRCACGAVVVGTRCSDCDHVY